MVVDDGISSGPYAAKLERAVRELAENLKSPSTGQYEADINVALVPATSGPSELWPRSASCALPSGAFLHAAELCDAPNNFQGDLADALTCAAMHIPATGQAPRPLQTLRNMLATHGPLESAGFRRKGAYLLLAIVSAEDDPDVASPEAVAELHDLIAASVEEPEYQVLAGVVAPAAAQSVAAFATSFAENGQVSDLAADRWDALPFLTDYQLATRPSYPCVDWPVVDADPITPGLQPDCVAIETHITVDGETVTRTEELLPRCAADAAAAGPCWRAQLDSYRCPPDELEFVVDRPKPTCLPSYLVRYSFTCSTRLQ